MFDSIVYSMVYSVVYPISFLLSILLFYFIVYFIFYVLCLRFLFHDCRYVHIALARHRCAHAAADYA